MKNINAGSRKLEDAEFERLFAKYENEMYRMAYIYVKNEAEALDVMQEAAYRAYKTRGSLKEAEYFRTWLIRITINCALDYIRKNSKTIAVGDEIEIKNVSAQEESAIIRRLTLESLMNALNEEEKSIIILKYYYEYSFREIGGILDKPMGSVKTALYRALGKLREKGKEADL